MLGIIALLTACGDKAKTNKDLQQAFEFHLEALEVRQTIKGQMAQLMANTDSLFVATHKGALDSLNGALESWDEQLVEVPGFEEEHDHSHHDHSDHDHSDHDHHHHDHAQQELTPKQHLEVQQHLLEEIKAIAEKVGAIE